MYLSPVYRVNVTAKYIETLLYICRGSCLVKKAYSNSYYEWNIPTLTPKPTATLHRARLYFSTQLGNYVKFNLHAISLAPVPTPLAGCNGIQHVAQPKSRRVQLFAKDFTRIISNCYVYRYMNIYVSPDASLSRTLVIKCWPPTIIHHWIFYQLYLCDYVFAKMQLMSTKYLFGVWKCFLISRIYIDDMYIYIWAHVEWWVEHRHGWLIKHGQYLDGWPPMNTKCLVPLPFPPDLILWSTKNRSHG